MVRRIVFAGRQLRGHGACTVRMHLLTLLQLCAMLPPPIAVPLPLHGCDAHLWLAGSVVPSRGGGVVARRAPQCARPPPAVPLQHYYNVLALEWPGVTWLQPRRRHAGTNVADDADGRGCVVVRIADAAAAAAWAEQVRQAAADACFLVDEWPGFGLGPRPHVVAALPLSARLVARVQVFLPHALPCGRY